MAQMEDVLDLYAEPYDPARPVACFDETSTQLLAGTRAPELARPGVPQRQGYEYRREGTRNLLLACEPLAGWRQVEVSERRTTVDFAQRMCWLADEAYPEAGVVRVVLDNLNTHQEGWRGDRWESRRLWTSTALNEYLDWPGQGQVCCVERVRRHKGKETVERAYVITSLPVERADAARLLEVWRGHWGIENRLHWVRDVVFGEDRPEPGAKGVDAATAGGPAELGDRHVAAERSEEHSGGPAPLRLETPGDPVPHRPLP